MDKILPFSVVESFSEQAADDREARRKQFFVRMKKFEELKEYWQKMPDDFLVKRSDREVYDIEEAGVAIGAEVEVLRTFQNFLLENFINNGILLANVDRAYFKQLAGGEKLLNHLKVSGYDFDKLMKYWGGKYNKFRSNWFSAVFGEAQNLIEEISDPKTKDEFIQELRSLVVRMKMVYGAPVQRLEQEEEKDAAMRERSLLIDATDEFLEKLIEYCADPEAVSK